MGDLQSRFPLQLKTHHYPKYAVSLEDFKGDEFRPFRLDRRVTSPWKLVWLNKKCCFEVLRLREITMKSPLRISFFGKKTWKSRRLRNSWKFTKWKTGSFTLNHFPFDAQGEMGTFRLIYKDNGIPRTRFPGCGEDGDRGWWSNFHIEKHFVFLCSFLWQGLVRYFLENLWRF